MTFVGKQPTKDENRERSTREHCISFTAPLIMKTTLILLSIATVASGFAPQGAAPASSRLSETATNGEATTVGAAGISGLTSDVKPIFTSEDIDKLLPHRYPFALVDKVVEYEAGKVSLPEGDV